MTNEQIQEIQDQLDLRIASILVDPDQEDFIELSALRSDVGFRHLVYEHVGGYIIDSDIDPGTFDYDQVFTIWWDAFYACLKRTSWKCYVSSLLLYLCLRACAKVADTILSDL